MEGCGNYLSVIVKPTNQCNLRCKHCYHAEKGYDEGLMDGEVLERMMSSILPYYDGATFIWHGGEPLMAPLSFYSKALELEKKYRSSPKQLIRNSMQSNGTFIDEATAKFIADNGILIGLSFEGPYNDFLRGKTEQTEQGYENLKKHKIVPGTISVVGKHNIDDLFSVYDYFRGKKRPVKLNPIFASGAAKENDGLLLDDPVYYAEKMSELFDLWLYDTGTASNIAPFLGYVEAVLMGKNRACSKSNCLNHWLGIDFNGDLYPCGRYYPEEYRLGNIKDFTDLHHVFETELYRSICEKTAIRSGKCKQACDIYEYCKGGCLNESILENGIENIPGFSCVSYKLLFKHIQKSMDFVLKTDGLHVNKFVKGLIDRKMRKQNI
jgi:uncharacterized protein